MNLTDNSGVKASAYDYKSFGQLRSQSGSAANPWLFTGRQFDSESGLYYYRNRYYDTRSGRFITKDPNNLISQASNLYFYTNNNPVNGIDPYGLDTYYVNYELFKDNPSPTNSAASHSYVAITDHGTVTDTFSWGNNGESGWFHSNPTDITVAQKAIDSGVGVKRYGGEDLDSFVISEYNNRKNDKSTDLTPYTVQLVS